MGLHGRPESGLGGRRIAIEEATSALRRIVADLQRLFAAHLPGELSMADLHALHFIGENGAATPGQIGAFTGLTSGSVTGLLDRLESQDLIERRRSEADRRVVEIWLRGDVHARLGARMHGVHGKTEALFAGLSLGQIQELARLLNLLGGES